VTRTGHFDGKPTPADLGIDLDALEWERSGHGDGRIEVAFPRCGAVGEPGGAGEAGVPGRADGAHESEVAGRVTWERGDWVLMRIAGDPGGRVLVFDRNEWECFLDGARKGEFDDAATP
jgi:hypothetical protein